MISAERTGEIQGQFLIQVPGIGLPAPIRAYLFGCCRSPRVLRSLVEPPFVEIGKLPSKIIIPVSAEGAAQPQPWYRLNLKKGISQNAVQVPAARIQYLLRKNVRSCLLSPY